LTYKCASGSDASDDASAAGQESDRFASAAATSRARPGWKTEQLRLSSHASFT
jgi:hypothetical protein